MCVSFVLSYVYKQDKSIQLKQVTQIYNFVSLNKFIPVIPNLKPAKDMYRKEISMNQSRNPSALRSKSEITEALINLMKYHDFSEITVKHILIEAQVARKTFYRNFTSKEDVLRSYIESIILEYVNQLTELAKLPKMINGTSRLSANNILHIIFAMCLENKPFLIYLHKNNLMHILLQQTNNAISKIHTQVVPSDHYLFSGITPEFTDYIISFNVGAIWNTINKWIENGMTDDPNTLIDQLGHFITNIGQAVP